MLCRRKVLLSAHRRTVWDVREQQLLSLSTRTCVAAALFSPTMWCTYAPMQQQTRSMCVSSVLLGIAETPVEPSSNISSEGTRPSGSGVTALDVAMRVNKLKRLHQTGGGPSGKKQIELDAWSDLNSLTEEQINSAEGKAVSLLLNSWAYFAKYWDKGKDGPLTTGASATGHTADASSTPP